VENNRVDEDTKGDNRRKMKNEGNESGKESDNFINHFYFFYVYIILFFILIHFLDIMFYNNYF
jgi:hypothetical protein